MAAKPFFSGRIPQDLFDAIEQHLEKTGESKTDVLVKALSAYVEHPTKWPLAPQAEQKGINDSRIEALEKSFETLKDRVDKLCDYAEKLENREITASQPKIPEGQMSLEEIVERDNAHDNETENKFDQNSEESKKRDNSHDNVDITKNKLLTFQEMMSISNKSYDTIRGAHRTGKTITVGSAKYEPVHLGDRKPRWKTTDSQ